MTELLTAVSIMFIVAGPFLLVANRFDLPTVPLLVLAGIVAGFGLDAFGIDEELTLELAQYGIALLVFAFGVDIDLSAVRTVIVDSEIAALAQVLVVGSLGVAFGVALGVPIEEAAFLGIAAALSSTMVGTALLRTEIATNLVRGRLARSIHFSQDLLAILLLLGLGAGTLAVGPIATLVGYGLALLAVAVLVNRYLFDAIGRLADDSAELMILGAVSLLAVFVGAAEYAGISIAVGAFAAGLAVRHDPVEYLGLFNGLESIKDFFVAIFFLTIGALVVLPFPFLPYVEIGWTESVEKLLLAGGLVLLTVVVKPAITTATLIYRGYEARSATLASLSSDQVSEFALIIAIEALILGLLTQSVFDAIILAAAVTMVVSSLTQRYDERIYRTLADRGVLSANHERIDTLSDVPRELSDHVVIVGYGRHGRKLIEACEEDNQPYVVIENDPVRRETVVAECDAFVFGDAMERYTWEKANVDDARIVVSTVDSDPVSRRLLSFEFDADLTLRANDRTIALELLEAGALYVSQSDLLAGQQLVTQIESVLDGERTPAELRDEQLAELESHSQATS
ncbi:potassium transporter Kef [Natronorubrum sp. JWXQ-INN-674]|uniref:Potassium transporter Kef n=1 Tax=Natronorubrum halalkaliphilum TaxID=2691917 RepID=A0A6B0VKY6_9EURY|nr:cation:proton antiporter [Natronorubrum halalkaliphilum]MXV62230.1 potassium transporter Kef [Natronorubrum halalkaliphilum]